MIDLFSLARLQPSERLEAVYRSHPLRLFFRLLIAASFFALPFFFLFDFTGWIWFIAIACWLVGVILFWLAFDIWSSALVLVTSVRLIGVQRSSWGRVRLHEWMLAPEQRQPHWKPWKLFPWLGTLTWKREDGVGLRLSWARTPQSYVAPISLGTRRRRLLRRLRKADVTLIETVEQSIDAK